jgi:hypothetical protein
MEIISLNSKDFKNIFQFPFHTYLNVDFNSLNKGKVEEVYFLGFKEKKYRLGLIIGLNKKNILSPFSAPFGGFVFIKSNISINYIEDALFELEKFAKTKHIKEIQITLPPSIYNERFISKQINTFYRAKYNFGNVELNNHFNLNEFNENYISNIWHNARKNLKIALNSDLVFEQCFNIEEKEKAYELIQLNRRVKGFPLKMSWQQVYKTIEIIKSSFFLVSYESSTIAAAMIFEVSEGIHQVIYWGDNPEFSKFKPMNFLSYKVFEHYKKIGAEIIDIGPSTENSIPNIGLAEFKESIGCSSSTKFTFKKRISY